MKTPLYQGNYLGIVVQNNDPLKRGRVKVFVPHVSPTVYKGWTEVIRDKKFKFVGVNTYSDLTDIVEDLKKVLPWAECAAPLAGESSSGRYSIYKNTGTISDSNRLDTTVSNVSSCEINPKILTKYTQNLDNIGEKPANLYDTYAYKINDAFTDPAETNVNNVNKYSYNYTPEAYSNSAKGAFAVPSVGSHLWVFFAGGEPMRPIYFATSFGAEDWNSIYQQSSDTENPDPSTDYPGEYENKRLKNENNYSPNIETYRNKYVINQKGGTLSFVNTDNRETLKLTHFSGSFKEFNNFTNIELASKNDQKLVLEDSFLTIRGDRNEFTQRDYDNVIKGNLYKKIGNLKQDLAQQWKDIVNELSNIKQLFEIRRARKITNAVLRYTSTKQTLEGNYAPCPVCSSDKDTYYTYNNSYANAAVGFLNSIFPSTADQSGDYTFSKTISIQGILNTISFPGIMGSPIVTTAIGSLGGGVLGGGTRNVSGQIFGDTCPACGGSGISPSSQDGIWDREDKKEQMQSFFDRNLKKLADIEEQLGTGGSEIIEITKHKIETIGTVMNDFASIRLDDVGKMDLSEVRIAKYGTFYNRTPSPVIEYVNVDDLPGGNYTLNVSNRYNILVGAGGLNLKSFGPVNMSGTITNVTGDQLNLASGNEVNIDGGKRLSVIADIISIRQRNKQQVLIDSSLGISRNLIVAGGAYIDGELFVNHVTAPVEYQQTEGKVIWGAAATDPTNSLGKIIGFGVPMSTLAVSKGTSFVPPLPGIFGADGTPPYLGYTDSTRIVGYIPVDTVATWDNPQIQTCGVCEIVVPGPNLTPIAVYGSGSANLSIKGSNQGAGGMDASQMPIVVYGTGRDNDSIFIPEHSHMFKNLPLNLVDTNADVREAAKVVHSGPAIPPAPINNSKK
jgi:hypothetical protein